MTCAQGLLRLLWGGGPEVGVLRDCAHVISLKCLGQVKDLILIMSSRKQVV